MTDKEFDKVVRGNILRNTLSGRSYVVADSRYDDVDKRIVHILVDAVEAMNPAEWMKAD